MSQLPHTAACHLLGCETPIVLAGMGGVSRSQLVGAVSRAGGFGFLGMVRESPAIMISEIERLRALGCDNFGVNIIPAATDADLLERQIGVCIDCSVPVVGLFWDIDEKIVGRLRAAGIVVVQQVGSADEALLAERAGVDLVIAQGREAGGHVRGTTALARLLPEVTNALNIPVLAAGGMGRGSDLVTALALGAEGIVLGTAFLATEESFAHAFHKERLLNAVAEDTVVTDVFHINWPADAMVRVLKSDVTSGVRGLPHGRPQEVICEEDGRPIYLFSTDSPLRTTTGDLGAMALYAGTGVDAVAFIPRAADRLKTILAEAEALLLVGGATPGKTVVSSPVCYADEMVGAYMGHLEPDVVRRQLKRLSLDMAQLLRAILLQDRADNNHPPFVQAGVDYARWSLLLRSLSAGERPRHDPPAAPVPPLEPNVAEVPRYLDEIRDWLSRLIPAIADPQTTETLIDLSTFIEGERLALFRN
ncbi:hypothetical protein GCM10007989_31850 [Devosia pacifica]|uniref:Nitronate monooxygenase n=1 Tax=Devosia pacifica TaxID=1335967 RepID=A0A918SCI9_9HYPH|nr:nitronate monooxygenase [Devosia pacifica]GHA33285.1 hypothetical protein GCM10007989_31850 [Devosia pacifica]